MTPRIPSTLGAVGNTPIVELTRLVPAGAARVLVKLEYLSPTGSYKDRMALSMIERAEARGTLKPGMTVVEYTGGSTGISLAFVCALKGYPCRIVTSDAVALEKRRAMEMSSGRGTRSSRSRWTADSSTCPATCTRLRRLLERFRELLELRIAFPQAHLHRREV